MSGVSPDWPMLLGRLHPVLVHFPIALLITAALFELCSVPFRSDRKSPWSAALACAVLGALASLAAVWSGWTNAEVESHGEAARGLITTHRWLGVATAALALIAAGAGALGAALGAARCTACYRVTLLLAALLVGLTGHWGGTLIYGEGYLTAALRAKPAEPAPNGIALPAPADPTDAPEAAAPAPDRGMMAVAQILESNCTKCHGSRRQRGRLRLDDLAAADLRPPARDVVVPGDPGASLLLHRVKLPRDHDDAMPPSEEGPGLTPNEIAAIEAWIAGHAPTGHAAPPGDPNPASIDANPDPAVPAPTDQTPVDPRPPADSPPLSATPAMDAALEAMRERGVVATRLSASDPWIEVRFDLLGPAIGDDDLALLEPVAEALVTLNLSGTGITDAGMRRLAGLPNLRTLHAARTGITDAGLAHLKELARLEHLNLHDAPITDAAIESLAAMDGLRRVYLWRTRVSDEGADRLRQRRPDLRIDLGVPPERTTPP